ncbi:MAG: low molecular weight protein-tyrosine-phosphatase [Steroidobacteraceae bacterium]
MRVLFVCLGNICRSPTAEGVARRLAAEAGLGADWEFDSAGTGDYHLGCAPDARAVRAALRRGVDLRALRARQVLPADFDRFDLILAMDRSNLASLERIRPRGSHAELRLFLAATRPQGLADVPDPYFGPDDGFEAVLDLCFVAAGELLASAPVRG